MPINNSTNRYTNSRYVVDNVTPGSPFATIQSAINAAVANGGNAEIWVRQGTYTENLTLYDGINIEGAEQTISIIIGTHVPPASGSCRFIRVKLQSATNVFSSAAAGTCLLSCLRCQFALTNGYVYNLPNWTGELRMRWCTDYSTHNGLVNNAGGSIITINHSLVGKGTTSVFTANGNVFMFSVYCEAPLLFNGTGTSILEGGSVFGGNISTANTHLLRIAQCRISSGAVQAITHNSATTLVLDSTIVGTSNAVAIGGTGTIKEIMVPFPTSSAIAGTITESLDGVTRTAELWANNITRMDDSGFYSWAAAGPYFDDTTLGTFQLLVGGTGYIKNKRVTWVAQNITGMTAGNCYYIYIDSTGTIGKTATRTDDLFLDNIVLFECMRDSTPVTNNQVTVKENHPYDAQPALSNYLHNNVGIVIQNTANGANITLNGTQGIQINGADVLADHGLNTTIPDSGGAAVTWVRMYTTATGKWARQNATTTFTGYWNNAGTPTALSANRFAVYTLYVSKDTLNATTPTYIAVLDTAQYISSGAATTAIGNGTTAKASNELAGLELAQLGYIIYRESTAAISSVIISKTTIRSSTTSTGTNQASLVNTNVTNFNGWMTSADTNVQAALDTLDDSQRCTIVTAASANLVAKQGIIADRGTLVTLTLPATAAVGDTINIVGKGTGGWLIAQNAGQTIHFLASDTTTGITGSLSSTGQYDCVEIICITANTDFVVRTSTGNLTIA